MRNTCPHLHAASAGQGTEATGADALLQPNQHREQMMFRATCLVFHRVLCTLRNCTHQRSSVAASIT